MLLLPHLLRAAVGDLDQQPLLGQPDQHALRELQLERDARGVRRELVPELEVVVALVDDVERGAGGDADLFRAGWVSMLPLEWLREECNHPARNRGDADRDGGQDDLSAVERQLRVAAGAGDLDRQVLGGRVVVQAERQREGAVHRGDRREGEADGARLADRELPGARLYLEERGLVRPGENTRDLP